MSNNLNFITFGCKLNAFETQVMKEKAEGYFLTNHSFINSCAVTNEAVKQSRRAIRKEDEATRAAGGTIDWGYMLWNLDW